MPLAPYSMHMTWVFNGQFQKKSKQWEVGYGQKNEIFHKGFSKKYVLNPLFFSGIAQRIQCLIQEIESHLQWRLILLFIFYIYKTTWYFKITLREKVENIKSLWQSYHSNKSNLTMVRDPCKWGCSWIIKFLIVWISDIANVIIIFSIWIQNGRSYMLHARRKTLEQHFFQELTSLLSVGKPFPGDLEG